jgi:hypothetical protein
MSNTVADQISEVLEQIDRPGTFCASGSDPAVLPGLEVEGLGPVSFPLTAKQAKELKKHCEQAPYGKGEKTLVDTSVRRVWHLTPEHFEVTNPDWEPFLKQAVKKVQEELGLEDQKLEAHLYDLLLYEPGSFFLPHRDGEKLARMVATLVIVLPSSFEGGELVVRHGGQEQTIDFSGDNLYRTHYAAFYADCEHEIRPLRKGYRLCLVYNLTLKKGKKGLKAPRTWESIEPLREILAGWAKDDTAGKLVVLLDHEYTKDGLTWDALKGADRAKASVLDEAARQADCRAYLALLTFHVCGEAEGGDYGYGYRRRYWDDDEEEDEEDASDYEMGDVIDSSLSAEHFSDSQGNRLPINEMNVEEEEVVDAERIEEVEPEEEFEGYTGNAGMTLDRWYRHGAILLWPSRKHFEVLCGAGVHNAVAVLAQMVGRLKRASRKNAEALRGDCTAFAAAIMTQWPEQEWGYGFGREDRDDDLLKSLAVLDDPELIRTYLTRVLARDAAADPGKALGPIAQKHGWKTFAAELEALFKATTTSTLVRNVHVLEQVCTAKGRKQEGWSELCASLAGATLKALETIDQQADQDWRAKEIDRTKLLASLARSLLASEQSELLARLVDHTLSRPAQYPFPDLHFKVLTALGPWLKKNVKKRSAALARWVAACREKLESLTAQIPQPPADWRRPSEVSCRCRDCAGLSQFLDDPNEQVYRFRAIQAARTHLEESIRRNHCDLNLRTEKGKSPYTLVCTKNDASYRAALKKFHQDQEHLKTLRGIEAGLPK